MSSDTNHRDTSLPSTSVGTHQGAFGVAEWGLLTGVALIWGSSFVFMAVGLQPIHSVVLTLPPGGLGPLTPAPIPQAA